MFNNQKYVKLPKPFGDNTFVILSASEAESIVPEDIIWGSDHLMWTNDKSKTVVSFVGDTPSWLEGKTTYSREEFFAIMYEPSNGWIPELEDA